MQGIITYFNPRKRFGFIATDQEEYFFFYPKQEGGKQHTIRVGDSVAFKVQVSEMKEGRTEAVIEFFYGNNRWEEFICSVRFQPLRTGYLKRIDEFWAVKVMPEKFMVRLDEISPFETNLETVYDLRNNLPVMATLSNNKEGEVTAVLEDRQFTSYYHKAVRANNVNEILKARIIDFNDQVYFATLYYGQLQVVIRRDSLPKGVQYTIGDEVDVRITTINLSTIAVNPVAYQTT